jgi:hypothetical protein
MTTFNVYKSQDDGSRTLLYSTENEEDAKSEMDKFTQELINANDPSVIFHEGIDYFEK